jgi:hypothetical protein
MQALARACGEHDPRALVREPRRDHLPEAGEQRLRCVR